MIRIQFYMKRMLASHSLSGYRIAGIFQGLQFSKILTMFCKPPKFNHKNFRLKQNLLNLKISTLYGIVQIGRFYAILYTFSITPGYNFVQNGC